MSRKRGWKEFTLSDILIDIQPGFARRPSSEAGNVAHLRTNNISSDGRLNLSELKFVPASDSEIEKYSLAKGDVLFNNTNSDTWIGKTAFVDRKLKALYSNHLTRLRVDRSKVGPRFLAIYLQKLQREGFFKSISTRWVNQTAVNTAALRALVLRLPTIEIQKRIVGIIELIDKVRQKREQANHMGNRFLEAVFGNMFSDLQPNDNRWPSGTFEEIAKIDRNNVKPLDIADETPYIGLKHIEKDTGRLSEFEIVKSGDLKSNKFSFSKNHILYGKLRPYLNKVSLPDFSGVCSTDILPILPINGKSNKHFIAYILKQKRFVTYATERAIGANLPRIKPDDINKFKIAIPPVDLQEQFASIAVRTNKLLEKQNQSTQDIAGLLISLIAKAFKGELFS